jgi:hypothetical protein
MTARSSPRLYSHALNGRWRALGLRTKQVEYALTDVDIHKAKLALRGNTADKQELKDRATKHEQRAWRILSPIAAEACSPAAVFTCAWCSAGRLRGRACAQAAGASSESCRSGPVYVLSRSCIGLILSPAGSSG